MVRCREGGETLRKPMVINIRVGWEQRVLKSYKLTARDKQIGQQQQQWTHTHTQKYQEHKLIHLIACGWCFFDGFPFGIIGRFNQGTHKYGEQGRFVNKILTG